MVAHSPFQYEWNMPLPTVFSVAILAQGFTCWFCFWLFMAVSDVDPATAAQLVELLGPVGDLCAVSIGYVKHKKSATFSDKISVDALATIVTTLQRFHGSCRPQHFFPSDSRLARKHAGELVLFNPFTTILCVMGTSHAGPQAPLGKGYCLLTLVRGTCTVEYDEGGSCCLELHTCSVNVAVCKTNFTLKCDALTVLLVLYLDMDILGNSFGFERQKK